MIIFHEGLPRSGKSYEALIQIIAWLKEGAKVYTNIAGINYKKISELSGLPENICRTQLICISNDDVQKIWETIPLPDDDGNGGEKDLRIVIDEIQDFFPTDRQKPRKELSTWVSSHGHAGWHILALGQDSRDVHNIFRRRIQRKIVFTKMTAVGAQNRYKWEAYEATRPEKFQSIGSGTKKYDKKYFGAYKSHVEGTINTGAQMDDRAIIWKRPAFKYGIPAFIIVIFFAVSTVVDFFTPKEAVAASVDNGIVKTIDQSSVNKSDNVRVKTSQIRKPKSSTVVKKEKKKEKPEPIDYVDDLANNYKFRLAGFIKTDTKYIASIEVLDKTFHMKERFSIDDLKEMGWKVEIYNYGLVIQKTDKKRSVRHIVRPWPIDPFGRASSKTRSDRRLKEST